VQFEEVFFSSGDIVTADLIVPDKEYLDACPKVAASADEGAFMRAFFNSTKK